MNPKSSPDTESVLDAAGGRSEISERHVPALGDAEKQMTFSFMTTLPKTNTIRQQLPAKDQKYGMGI